MLIEVGHDEFVGSDAVAVVLVLAGLYKYGVTVAVVGEKDLLVYTEILSRKAAHAVGVDLSDGIDYYVYFVVGGVWEQDGDVVRNGSRGGNRFIVSFELCGANTLEGLWHVSFVGLFTLGAVFVGVGIGKTRIGGEVAGLYGSQPS